jgi:RimJ/RimL family protein N-acetyltransferase
VIRTERLLLRRWRPEDAAPLAALNADPEVMRFVGGPIGRAASDGTIARSTAFHAARGYGRWAVEHEGALLGYVGLGTHPVIGDGVEIGWRLARSAWGRGFATEGARAVVAAAPAFGLDRLVAVVHPDNAASVAVCRRLGMAPERTTDGGLSVYALTTSRSEPGNVGWSRSAP